MNKGTDFQLSKWYLDCVADNGDTFIGYSAMLHIKGIAINFTSILSHSDKSGTLTEISLRKSSFPQIKDETIHWSFPPLKIKATWHTLAQPIHQQLYETSEGSIQWSCLQPNSDADVYFGKGGHVRGKGYVEKIEMTIKPWQLPIDELRWGRFLSNTDAVVWIDWVGEAKQSLLFHNGVQMNNCSITDNEIKINRNEKVIALTEKTILREGRLISTILSKIPGIEKIVPLKILQTHECKWCSRGILKKKDFSSTTGWAIHEVVRFK